LVSCKNQDIVDAVENNQCVIETSNEHGEAQQEKRPCQVTGHTEENHEHPVTVNYVLRNFTAAQEAKMKIILDKILIAINSKEFKEMVLNYQYQGQNTFVDNDGMDNESIYETIMAGAEILKPEPDKVMDLDITMYYSIKNTVGYTYPDTLRIWINSKFYNSFTHAEAANNVVHEWLHKLGFSHSYSYNAARDHSVPYAVGGIIEQLIEKM
jgi:hypothetical protein